MSKQKKVLTKKRKHPKNNYRKINNKKTTKKYKLQQHGSGPEEEASKSIGKFILKNKDKLHSKQLTTKYLKTICEDSGACISFGTEVNKINELFENFTNFKYAKSPVIALGEESDNGFVKQIQYIRNDYECYAVLKSSLANYSDNLMYEYEVGVNFINKQNKIFPCFLETYGLYDYKDEASWSNSRESDQMEIEDLKNNLQKLESIDYTIGCPKSKYISILIQHVKNAVNLKDFSSKIVFDKNLSLSRKNEIANIDIPLILYQIYMPLATLFDQFTHYDLHSGNILLYEPVKGSYITYNYYLNSGKIIQFKSPFIVKIIDYGRCYYNNGTQNSFDTYSKIKEMESCNDLDGVGFGTFAEIKTKIEKSGYDATNYICSHKSNVSCDLDPAFYLYSFLKDKKILSQDLLDILKRINFRMMISRTKETKESGLPDKINNITDLSIKLEEYISTPGFIEANNNQFETAPKIGDFHIYQDGRPMNFNNANKKTLSSKKTSVKKEHHKSSSSKSV